MKHLFRTCLAVLSAFSLVCTGFPCNASATEALDHLALGDSISTGYGLDVPEEQGFVYLLSNSIGSNLVNQSVDGNTAAGIYEQIRYGEMDEWIVNAELITITCGGNDMMGLLYTRIAEEYNASSQVSKITADDVAVILAGMHPTIAPKNLLLYALRAITDFSETERFAAELATYTESLTAVMQYINEKNPDAYVIVNTQYNPYKIFQGHSFYNVVYTEMDAGTIALNEVILSHADALGYTVADVYTAFIQCEEDLCTADGSMPMEPNFDFHPNAAGHVMIAEVVENAMPCTHENCTASAYQGNQNGSHQVIYDPCGTIVTESCNGGDASCTDLAVCVFCGEEYGSYGMHILENSSCIVCNAPAIDAVHFPNEAFRSYVDAHYDITDDDILSAEEAAAVQEMDLSGIGIADLTGIAHFTALTSLCCDDNQLTSLDLSGNPVLTELSCTGNSFAVTLNGGLFDLSAMPSGFDAAKASEWQQASVEGMQLTIADPSTEVTYRYDCGNGLGAEFSLHPTSCTLTDSMLPAILPQNYSGEAIEPEIAIHTGNYKLIPDTDYTVSYENNTEVGMASVKITGTGFFAGEIIAAFEIIPPLETTAPETTVPETTAFETTESSETSASESTATTGTTVSDNQQLPQTGYLFRSYEIMMIAASVMLMGAYWIILSRRKEN